MPGKAASTAGRPGPCGLRSLRTAGPLRHRGWWQLHSRLASRSHRRGQASHDLLSTGCQTRCATGVASAAETGASAPRQQSNTGKPRVLIAGAGIGGLVLAVGLLNKGMDVQVFERDLTAIRGEGKYRGPIQVPTSDACCITVHAASGAK